MRWFFFATLALVLAGPAPAADRAYPYAVSKKFARGMSNLLRSPMEIWRNARKESCHSFRAGGNYNRNAASGFAGGVVGFGYMLARIAVGAYEIATFPIPSDPVMYPAFLYQADPVRERPKSQESPCDFPP